MTLYCVVVQLKRWLQTNKDSTILTKAWTDAYWADGFVTANSAPLLLLFIELYQNITYFVNTRLVEIKTLFLI